MSQSDISVEILTAEDTLAVNFCIDYLVNAWEVAHEYALGKLKLCLQQVDGSFSLVAKLAGKPIGMVMYHYNTGFDLPMVKHWVTGLYVEPQYRNTPAMLRIMWALRKEFRGRLVSCVHCGVDDHNAVLQGFYKKLGFGPTNIPKQQNAGHFYDIVELAI